MIAVTVTCTFIFIGSVFVALGFIVIKRTNNDR